VRVLALAAALVVVATASGSSEVRRIRLCADPSNLPFSSQNEQDPGFEVEIARAIAQSLGVGFSVHWFPTAIEVVAFRQLYDDRCDVLMGMPISERFTNDKPRLTFSVPYYLMGQAIISSSLGAVRSLDDLKGKVIGVQAMTLSDQLVYERALIRKVYLSPEETFTAVARGEVDAAVMESPLAGWYVKKNPGFRASAITDPLRELRIGAAVRETGRELKDALDRTIQDLQSTKIPDILARYGVTLAQGTSENAPSSLEPRGARSTYLTQCSQCHGTDARGTPAAANLLAFKGSEDDFLRIVQTGRPGTAMTPWKGIIPDDDIRGIARYIKQLPKD